MPARTWMCALLPALCSAQTITVQQSHTTENLRGLSAVSSKIVWASGTHGTYLRTLDGGRTWVAAQVPGAEPLDFRDVEAFSADDAYLLSAGPGEQSRIYKTSDGGRTWTLQFTNAEPRGFYDCMAFWDRTHGIAIGDSINGKFELITTDDGIHWNILTPPTLPAALEGEGSFAASGTCITVQGQSNVWFATGVKTARVFRSHDRGKSWAVADAPITHGTDSSGVFSIFMADDKHGLISGGDYKHPEEEGPNLAYTEDSGATWKLSPVQHQPFLSAVGYLDPQRARGMLAAGSDRLLFAQDVQQDRSLAFRDLNLNALAFVAPKDAWAVGPKGVIVRWVPGGGAVKGRD